MGAPGAGVRLAAQPRRALRQRGFRARARHDRALAPAEIPDEAGERQVPAPLLGSGDQRDRRQDARHPQGIRAGRADARRLLQAQQRAVDAGAQVGVAVGHQQHRPPGPHLPFDHGRRHGPDLGLRRDDQLLQRRAVLEEPALSRLERRRGAPGFDAAHAARQGKRLQGDRRRPAFHAHRREGRYLRAHPFGERHRVHLRDPSPRFQERLGGQGLHQGPRLRHGQGQGRSDEEVDPGQGDRGHRGSGGGGLQRRQDAGREPAGLHHLGDGSDATHHRQRRRAREQHSDARARQRRALGRRLQHLPRPRQRPGRDRRRSQPRYAAGLLPGGGARLLGALGARLERGPQMAPGPLRPGHDGQARA